MGFWDRVRFEIKGQRTTQDWVAKKAGLRLNTFQGWISKGRLPDVEEAHAIAHALNVSVEYLVTGADSTDPWIHDHRQLVDNLKALTLERLDDVTDQVEKLAEKSRRELGKISSSGSTAT